MKWMKTLLWTVAFILAILFSMQNRDEVVLRLGFRPFWDFEKEVAGVPLFLVILCSIFVGVVIGGISDFYRRFQLKKTLRENQKTIERLQREIESLQGSDSD